MKIGEGGVVRNESVLDIPSLYPPKAKMKQQT